MPKKLAFFVEGQTEQIFVRRLIAEVAGGHRVEFEIHARSNGVLSMHSIPAEGHTEYFVLIFDCGSDGAVKSAILDRWASLVGAGYDLVLGLRDLFPVPLRKVAEVEASLGIGLPAGPPEVEILLSVAEIEAWFLQEATHYSRIDPALDVGMFKAAHGFDPTIDSAELIAAPADLLKTIYRQAGKTYKKKRFHVERTVGALDFAELCFASRTLVPRFGVLADRLDSFFI